MIEKGDLVRIIYNSDNYGNHFEVKTSNIKKWMMYQINEESKMRIKMVEKCDGKIGKIIHIKEIDGYGRLDEFGVKIFSFTDRVNGFLIIHSNEFIKLNKKERFLYRMGLQNDAN